MEAYLTVSQAKQPVTAPPHTGKGYESTEITKTVLEKGRRPPPRYPKWEQTTPDAARNQPEAVRKVSVFPLLKDATHPPAAPAAPPPQALAAAAPSRAAGEPGGGPPSCRGHAHHTGTTAAPRL